MQKKRYAIEMTIEFEQTTMTTTKAQRNQMIEQNTRERHFTAFLVEPHDKSHITDEPHEKRARHTQQCL